MESILLILVATLAYAGSILAFGRGAAHLNSNILGAIVNLIGTLVPIALFAFVASQRYSASGIPSKGYLWAIFGGVCIGLFTLAITRVFSIGGNVSFVTPLVYGGAVFIASAISIILFKEKVALFQTIGMMLIIAGVLSISYSTWSQGK